MSDFPVNVRLEHTESGRTIHGIQRWLYPVDEPPVIDADGLRLYRNVWRARGWVIHESGES